MKSPHPDIDSAQEKWLLDALEKYELGRVADPLLAEARPQLVLQAGQVYEGEGPPPLGKSRLGGTPDLPPGTAWPELRGEPLIMTAQIRFDELSVPAEWPLPREGLLSLFMGDDEERFAVDHELIYTADPVSLERLPAPKMQEREHLRACPVEPAMTVTLPGYGEDAWTALEMEDDETDRYFSFQESMPGGHASLLGRDYDVDELPTERLAIDRLGGPNYDYHWKKENIDRVRAEAHKWVPLFQMDSNHRIGLNMWDAYTFVVLIQWEDLLNKRFDRTRAQLARR